MDAEGHTPISEGREGRLRAYAARVTLRRFATVVLLGVALTGCAGTPPAASAPDPVPASPSPVAPAAPGPVIVAFGQAYTFADGSTITMTVKPFTPRKPAQFGPKFVAVTGTLTIHGPAPVGAMILISESSAGQPVNAIAYPEAHLLSGVLLPGQSQTFLQPYPVTDPTADMVVGVLAPTAPGVYGAAPVAYFQGAPA